MTYDAAALALDDTLGTDEVPHDSDPTPAPPRTDEVPWVERPPMPAPPKTTADHERAKYARMWAIDDYHGHSPGKIWASRLGGLVDLKPDQTVIDLGCGAGEAAAALEALGLDVAQVDLADFRGTDNNRPFRAAPLWSDWSFPGRFMRADYGFCCDVMEHIPPEYVMLVLERIRANCQAVFFSIAHLPDRCGAMIGEPLHLTLRPFEWWRDRIGEQMGEVLDGRDLMGDSMFYVRCR